MKRSLLISITVLSLLTVVNAQERSRRIIHFPDINGYKALKCDFHLHTMFSDGNVWPVIRVEEAWREGLDAIAITDHIEYVPHEDDVNINYERSFEIAAPAAAATAITLIRGAEITRSMPPGHFNAIITKNNTELKTENWADALQKASDQGAFLFWNHPGWKGQQPDGIEKWYQEHTAIFDKGLMHGIEIVNGTEYYPLAHRWALEKNLTILGNTDAHGLISYDYNMQKGLGRPMTLVLAKETSPEAIHDALKKRRTLVHLDGNLYGSAEYLQAVFDAAVTTLNAECQLIGKRQAYIQLQNDSDLDYKLALQNQVEGIEVADELLLPANKIVVLTLRGKNLFNEKRNIKIPYQVKNLHPNPDQGLNVDIKVGVEFVKTEK